jgi:voltage-gated potassium channel
MDPQSISTDLTTANTTEDLQSGQLMPSRRLTYEIFISFVTVIALLNAAAFYLASIPSVVKEVLIITDGIYAIVLLIDFFIRLFNSPKKLHYLIRRLGFLDFLSGIPGLPFLRLLRLPRLIVTTIWLRRRTSREMVIEARRRLAESTLLIITLMVLIMVTVGSVAVVTVESKSPDANITTGQEAVWWSIVTIATVGYGDYTPVTGAGRVFGSIMIFLGISAFSALTSYIASQFINARAQDAEFKRLHEEIAELHKLIQPGGNPAQDRPEKNS